MSEPFFVLSTPGVVEVWSTVRLPYEPRGWLIDLRSQLRVALTDLSQTSSGQLHAIYSAADDGAFVDVENVLLYNVGGTALRSLTKNSVTIERGYHVPIPPPRAGFTDPGALHYHRYGEAHEAPRGCWEPGVELGAFTDAPADAIGKPAPIWKSIRDSAAPPNQTAPLPVKFLVNVHVTDTLLPGGTGSVFGIIKPLLDGIISAYHSHEGSDGATESQLLSGLGLGAEEDLCNELLDPRWAALGPRRLVRPFGATGVQWNPADDFCVFAHVTLNSGAADSMENPARWRITAELRVAST